MVGGRLQRMGRTCAVRWWSCESGDIKSCGQKTHPALEAPAGLGEKSELSSYRSRYGWKSAKVPGPRLGLSYNL